MLYPAHPLVWTLRASQCSFPVRYKMQSHCEQETASRRATGTSGSTLRRKRPPVALRGGLISGPSPSAQPPNPPSGLPRAGSATARTKDLHSSLDKPHPACTPQLHPRVLWEIPILVHLPAYKCLSVCTHRHMLIHSPISLQPCVHTLVYLGPSLDMHIFQELWRVCKHVCEDSSDVYINQVGCQAVGTQGEPPTQWFFKVMNCQYSWPLNNLAHSQKSTYSL